MIVSRFVKFSTSAAGAVGAEIRLKGIELVGEFFDFFVKQAPDREHTCQLAIRIDHRRSEERRVGKECRL